MTYVDRRASTTLTFPFTFQGYFSRQVKVKFHISSCLQAIQAKQDSLLERANQLDQECEDLQNKLAEMEEEREELIKECEANKQENEIAAKTTSELQVRKILFQNKQPVWVPVWV